MYLKIFVCYATHHLDKIGKVTSDCILDQENITKLKLPFALPKTQPTYAHAVCDMPKEKAKKSEVVSKIGDKMK